MMNKNNIAFVFPGQGSQTIGMGKELYDNFNSAKEIFQIIDDKLNYKLSKIIFNGPSEELTKTENAQPALMAVSIAIVNVIEKEFNKSLTNLCSIVAGHSLGEYSALCSAKSISIEDTSYLLQVRGESMAKCGTKTQGAMAAILGSDFDKINQITKEVSNGNEYCQIANDNSNGQIVISGSKIAIDKAITIAKENGIKKAILLPVSGAFHSNLMQEAATKMSEALEKTTITTPNLKFINNINADFLSDPLLIKNSLIKQITESVRWRETMLLMEANNIRIIVEIGSGKVLSGLASRTCKDIKTISVQYPQDIEDLLKLY